MVILILAIFMNQMEQRSDFMSTGAIKFIGVWFCSCAVKRWAKWFQSVLKQGFWARKKYWHTCSMYHSWCMWFTLATILIQVYPTINPCPFKEHKEFKQSMLLASIPRIRGTNKILRAGYSFGHRLFVAGMVSSRNLGHDNQLSWRSVLEHA